MTIFRVTYHSKGKKTYDFFTHSATAGAAVIRARERGEKAEVEAPFQVNLTRDGLLSALQKFGSHADD